MKHIYTIYYLLGGRDQKSAEQELFAHGYSACQSYDCDYRQFDPTFGVLICRKANENGEFVEEMDIPAPFYMGEVRHTGVQEFHDKCMKKNQELQETMIEMMNKTPSPHNGVDAT